MASFGQDNTRAFSSRAEGKLLRRPAPVLSVPSPFRAPVYGSHVLHLQGPGPAPVTLLVDDLPVAPGELGRPVRLPSFLR
ncbi:hypothetical protein CONLIGDRAFT_628770 [Coniochaeta ligniaria NRRL 30616]|uniref:Uncharacterized protein n=1 Tax=Coniochaeta ligniaria NRRL 30616 TaxID=1408157 RepID=A0A1J7J3B6_9PEZI|nr:hypothetical protein CONLIGDRAFT_628770 [Coniochaeta ligniaria NRRL 30616]